MHFGRIGKYLPAIQLFMHVHMKVSNLVSIYLGGSEEHTVFQTLEGSLDSIFSIDGTFRKEWNVCLMLQTSSFKTCQAFLFW